MSLYRSNSPQRSGGAFLTDGGSGAKLGYSAQGLAEVRRVSLAFPFTLRVADAADHTPVVIDGIATLAGEKPEEVLRALPIISRYIETNP